MKYIAGLGWKVRRWLRTWIDTRGQDLIEYALMASFIAVGAGAVIPNLAASISAIFTKVIAALTAATAAS